jgi:hypothetical protein
MGLEEDVKKVMDNAVEATVPMLEATAAGADPNAPLDLLAQIQIIDGQLVGLKRAVLLLAREVDQLRDE